MAQGYSPSDVAGIGITNQRETLIVWDRFTGKPLYNAIVWSDLRTDELCHIVEAEVGGKDSFRAICGLPISTYFSGLKLRWLQENVPSIADAIQNGSAMVGTVDSWLVWSLTGGQNGGVHVTDVSNASRTMLMSLATQQWDEGLCSALKVRKDLLPEIRSNSEIYGHISAGALAGIPLSGCVGDQQAALLGQLCLEPGHAKNTYGTGCFLLANTGDVPVQSAHGLLSTVAFKLGPDAPCKFALEGSVAVAGAAVTWLQDSLGMVSSPEEFSTLASSVTDAGGMYFVPAFSGLLSPHWRDDARGTMVGITRFITKAHFCRAALEAAAYQTSDVLDAMEKDAGFPVSSLKVDGGLSRSSALCQFQADILGRPVFRPVMDERTALGAAFAAGLAEGVEVWNGIEDLKQATVRCDPNEMRMNTSISATSTSQEVMKKDDEGKYQDTGLLVQIEELEVGDWAEKEENQGAGEYTSPHRRLSRRLSFEEQFIMYRPTANFNREERLRGWHKAIQRSLDWVE